MKAKRNLLAVILCSVVLGAGDLPLQADSDSCKPVSGPFSSVLVGGDECESPIGLCTHGILTGNFHATYDFTMVTLQPSDPSNPNKLVYTGVSVITLKSGKKMYSMDTGVMDTTDPEAAPFVTTANIYSGTGRYQGGQFVASGTLNLITGEAVGSYVGEICKVKKSEQ